MNIRSRTRLTTVWLGLFAMWLIVFAPAISQLIASADRYDPVASECSATSAAEHDGIDHHASSSSTLTACGYCDLLATHAAMPFVPPASVSARVLVTLAPSAAFSTRFIPLGAYPSGRPRAPPVAS